MTSVPYPTEYYPPEYIESRMDNPYVSPPTHQLLSRSVTTTSHFKQPLDDLPFNVGTNQRLPDHHTEQPIRKHRKNLLPHNTEERNIPKSIINEKAMKPSTYPLKTLESKQFSKNPTNISVPNKTKEPNKNQSQQQTVQIVEDPQAMDGYWKTGTLFNSQGIIGMGPVVYNENPYAGPFGLNRIGAYIYYIGLCVFIFLASVFLIMTVIFYTQKYPNSSSNIGNLVGVCICAFAVYLGIQLILVGLWNQKYRREHPKKKIPNKKPRLIYTPYGYYLYPQYFSSISKEKLSRPKIESNTNELPPKEFIESPPNKFVESPPNKFVEPSPPPLRSMEVPPTIPEFYFLQSSLVIVSNETSADESETNRKAELTNRTAKTNRTTGKSTKDVGRSSKMKKPIKSGDNKTTRTPSTERSTNIRSVHRKVLLEPHLGQSTSRNTTTPRENSNAQSGIIGDLQIEDVNSSQIKMKKNKSSSNNPLGNAFYD